MFLNNADYELVGLRDGVAILRNIETGEQIERKIVVNLNSGTLRIADPRRLGLCEAGQRPSFLGVQKLD